MSTSKEEFIAATGGFRPGESEEQFNARVAEIQRIEDRIQTGNFSEEDHRRLCKLKDIDLDDYDPNDHPNA